MNTCYISSTYSTCSVEEICAAAPNGYRWFQLYVYRDRKLSEQLVHRVEALGYKALVLTVDVPYTGKRRDDIRNQFKLPPHLKVKNFDGMFQVMIYCTFTRIFFLSHTVLCSIYILFSYMIAFCLPICFSAVIVVLILFYWCVSCLL